MNRLNVFLGWIAELMILIALFWKCLGLSDLAISIRVLLCTLLSIPIIMFFLWNLYKKSIVIQTVRINFILISGLSLVLCLFLIVNISIELKKVSTVGGATKEMVEIAREKEVPHIYFQQWTNDTVERMKSERLMLGMLLLSIGLILNKNHLAVELSNSHNQPGRLGKDS